MEFAKLRKKAILGVPLPIVAILALTITAAVALFIIEQRFGGTMAVTESLVVVYEADGTTPLEVPINGISIPVDILEYEYTKVFVIENKYIGSIDLAAWAYLDGLDEVHFSYVIDANRSDMAYWPDITDPSVRLAGAGAGKTLGLETSNLWATCTLTITLTDRVGLVEDAYTFELVVLAEQVDDWNVPPWTP